MEEIYLPKIKKLIEGNIGQILEVVFKNAIYCAKNQYYYDILNGKIIQKKDDDRYYYYVDSFQPPGAYCILENSLTQDQFLEIIEQRKNFSIQQIEQNLIYFMDRTFCFEKNTNDEEILKEIKKLAKNPINVTFWIKKPSDYSGFGKFL